MKTTTYNWLCPECDLRIEVPTVEQIERLRTEHVRAEHPEYLDEVEGRIDVPVQMFDSRLHYGDEDIAWVACRLCGDRQEIPVSPAIYPTYSEAAEAVEAVADVFSRTHVARHKDALVDAALDPPENPFDDTRLVW